MTTPVKQIFKNGIYSFIPFKYRFGKTFLNTYQFVKNSREWPVEKLEDYRWQELVSALRFAEEYSPYYQALLKKNGVTTNDIKNYTDFRKAIPLLKRDQIIEKKEEIAAQHENIRKKYVTTSGTSGRQLGFYIEKNITYPKTLAFEWFQFNEGGCFFDDPVVVLRGKIIKKGISTYEKRTNSLFLSSFDLIPGKIPEFIQAIQDFKPRHIRAYPSSLEVIAKYVKNTGIPFNKDGFIQSLFTTSENLSEEQRKLFEEVLKLKVFDKYGNSEQCTIIGQCREGNYHDYMQYSFTEFLDENDEPVITGKARIVSTSFVNYAMPFIRYDTGDYVELDNNRCTCGMQHLTVKKITGRRNEDEYIIGKNGNVVSITSLNMHSDVYDKILKHQYSQEKKGYIEFRIVPGRNYSGDVNKYIHDELKSRLKENFEISVKEVKDVELTARGKYKIVIQKLNVNDN